MTTPIPDAAAILVVIASSPPFTEALADLPQLPESEAWVIERRAVVPDFSEGME